LKIRKTIQIIWDSLRGKEHDYTKGSLNEALLLLSIPMIMEMVMESLFAVVDIYFVSKLGDNDAVATVGLTESVLMLVESVAIGVAMAATAMVARRIGEKNIPAASKAGMQAVLLGVIVSLIVGVFAFIFAEDILRMMGGSETLIEKGKSYTQIILSFNIVLMLLFLFNGIFRGAGNPAMAMYTLYLANGINIVLDPCLIHGYFFFPKMGLEGAAIASVIGRGVGVLFQIYILVKGYSIIKVYLKDLLPDIKLLKNLSKVSLGGAGQFLLSTASWIFLVRILAGFGSSVLAGYTIGIRVIIFTILPSWGLANAAATLVGQNLGANQAERAEKTVWTAAKYNTFFLVFVAIVFFIFADPVLAMFTSDQAVISEGSICLKILCTSYLFFGYGMIISQAFNGAGDTYTPTKINFIGNWIIQIPLAYGLAIYLGLGPTGVYSAIVIAALFIMIMAIYLFRKGKWKHVNL